jgi:hypothetical protein
MLEQRKFYAREITTRCSPLITTFEIHHGFYAALTNTLPELPCLLIVDGDDIHSFDNRY